MRNYSLLLGAPREMAGATVGIVIAVVVIVALGLLT